MITHPGFFFFSSSRVAGPLCVQAGAFYGGGFLFFFMLRRTRYAKQGSWEEGRLFGGFLLKRVSAIFKEA
jgi:hypothetical protein